MHLKMIFEYFESENMFEDQLIEKRAENVDEKVDTRNNYRKSPAIATSKVSLMVNQEASKRSILVKNPLNENKDLFNNHGPRTFSTNRNLRDKKRLTEITENTNS
jgi:hypothetical protein